VTTTPPRYSRCIFPAYAHVPGETPHPTRSPSGHSFNVKQSESPEALNPAAWQDCEAYLFGIDLFNFGFWWEAHEAWEEPWHAAGRRSSTGLFLQGLIQVSVARLKWAQDLWRPARRLATDGRAKLSLNKGTFAGLQVAPYCERVGVFFETRESRLEAQPPLTISLESSDILLPR
jgi:hypothetical protein